MEQREKSEDASLAEEAPDGVKDSEEEETERKREKGRTTTSNLEAE